MGQVRKGMSVAVVERNAKAVGPSIRNSASSPIPGKGGEHRACARRSRDICAEVAEAAGST